MTAVTSVFKWKWIYGQPKSQRKKRKKSFSWMKMFIRAGEIHFIILILARLCLIFDLESRQEKNSNKITLWWDNKVERRCLLMKSPRKIFKQFFIFRPIKRCKFCAQNIFSRWHNCMVLNFLENLSSASTAVISSSKLMAFEFLF